MIESVRVIGARGRVGAALAGRLAARGLDLEVSAPDLVLLCVPDRAISTVAREIEPGPWVAHVSGATPLSALDPHVRRFGVHPLQTFTHRRGPEQLDGAAAAVTGETEGRSKSASGSRARSASTPSSSTTRAAPPTTRGRRWRPTTS
jgi:predicted short-subunit dehydrogenase-like oxidoreductase (DUF2520 family)